MDKLDVIVELINSNQQANKERFDDVKQLLEDHMEQSSVANSEIKQEIKTVESRVEKLEEPGKVLKVVKSAVLYVSSFAGALLLISKAWAFFN